MQWLTDWWQGMNGVQQIFAVIAVPATVVLILQTILLLFGVGGGHDADHGEVHFGSPADDAPDLDASGEADADFDAHDAAHHGDGLRILTVRGLVAFFAVGGWLGVALLDAGLQTGAAIVLALAGGFAALLLVAFILKWSLKLQENGTLDLRNAIAHTATVYIRIPPARSGSGKVTLTVQEQFVELDAVTDDPRGLSTGAQVQVTGVAAGNTLIVRSFSHAEE